MRLRKERFFLGFTVLVFALAGSSATFGQSECPAAPNYSPDFSSNQSCLTPNGNAAIVPPSGGPATITSWSGSGGFVTFQASNSFAAGEVVTLSGFASSTFFDGLAAQVLSTGLTTSQFEIAFSGYSGNSDTGTATPNTILQLTPNTTFQAGSAWYNAQQSVANGFSTTFTFQLSNPSLGSLGNADGIAFVIQSSATGTAAIGPNGCGMGFAQGSCTASSGGISNSLAVAFKTYNDGYPSPNNNSVLIVSDGMGPNCIDEACSIAYNNSLPNGITLADGNIHAVTISYTPTPTQSSSPNCFATVGTTSTPEPCLDVILDGQDLFAGGVQLILDGTTTPLSLQALIGSTGSAYVGFTGGTGGGDDNQDILSWIFTPQGQTQTLQPLVPATYSFQNNAYSYQATLSSGSATTTTVTPIYPNTSSYPYSCDTLVQQTYPGAHCIVYTNLGTGVPDSPVMFEVTCPNLPGDQCNPFSAELGTTYALSTQNSINTCINTNSCTGTSNDPFPGWVKGAGPDAVHPCTPWPNNDEALFQSNQIDSFSVDEVTHGKSGGTGSCWVATYDQPGEALSVITITSPTNNAVYAQNASIPASYACANPTSTQSTTSAVGPYLTTASCTQSSGTPATCNPATPPATGLVCTGGTVNTSAPGAYQFTVTGTDTGENGNTATVSYTVVAPTNLQILNLGPPGPVGNGGYITYAIGVADLGPANADGVTVTDPLPSNTTFVSGSGNNTSCGLVNKKLSCLSTAFQCSANGGTVSCNVGTLAPLSLSSLNGGTMTIKVEVTGEPNTTCGKKAQPCTINTATVSAINTDTNSNPSSTVDTTW